MNAVTAAAGGTRCTIGALGLLSLVLAAPCLAERSALVQAVTDGDEATAIALIEDGADVSQAGHNGDTALHWAAFRGQLNLARRLLAAGAPVNARVRNGNTPLHQAAYAGHLEMARMLLGAGADINAVDARGATPAGWADRNGHQPLLRYLVEHGARVALGSNADGPMRQRAGSAQALPAGARPRANSGLSRRMGELPPVVLRVPSSVAKVAPMLSLSRDIYRIPRRPLDTAETDGKSVPGQAWLQLGALRRRSDANVHREMLLARYGDLLGDRRIDIVAAEIEGRGLYHRLRTGPLPKAQAEQTCHALKSRGAKCLLVFSQP